MKISDDTRRVIEFLEAYSEEGLRKKNDLEVLLEISASRGDFAFANKLIFTGKSVFKLYKTFKKSTGNNADALKTQLSSSIEDLRRLLRSATDDADEQIKKRFEETYFVDTNGAVANLIDLSHDLSVLKDLQTDRNQSIKQQNNDL
ncbi:MAG TPA: hypothetical protein PLU67_07825 [Candidatus Kapabacteria bacterium]|jgi:Sec-independent protein translocase protein TatA|nr:hypothetical protein [Candidatus Kapabacteria bacterium]HOQ48619.1 hypothetical protein [Candidatus Kapabacteria bacterium]HPP39174.1 hypothetical protein [Candidatus Kapabacteria bacterium]